MARILIIDDDQLLVFTMAETIAALGHKVDVAATITQGMALANNDLFDLIFLDVFLPDGYGLNYIPDLQQTPGKPDIIIITGTADIDGAALAMKSGAWDYMCKPFNTTEAKFQMDRVLQYRKEVLTPPSCTALKRHTIIGSSPQLNLCLDKVAQAATTTVNVLVTGETGTGKELFAQAIHDNSSRNGNSFVVLDCSVLPERLVETTLFGYEKGAFTGADRSSDGLIHQADKGTLFLDEVGELTLESQKIFLRVLQEKRYRSVGGTQERDSEFRLVAATNKDLDAMVEAGEFRQDLLFRLKAFTIDLPPLKDRVSDIVDIALHHLSEICRQNQVEIKGLSPEFMDALGQYDWPGNVRELVNALERAVAAAAFSPVLFPVHLPGSIRTQNLRDRIHPSSPEIQNHDTQKHGIRKHENLAQQGFPTLKTARDNAIAGAESRYLHELVTLSGGHVQKACRLSGLKRTRLWELYKKYGIQKTKVLEK